MISMKVANDDAIAYDNDNIIIDRIYYGELYHNNDSDSDVLYLECLAKRSVDHDGFERAIVRFPRFEPKVNEIDDLEKLVETKKAFKITHSKPLEMSLASKIHDYKYSSIKEEVEKATGVFYNETLLCTISQQDNETAIDEYEI